MGATTGQARACHGAARLRAGLAGSPADRGKTAKLAHPGPGGRTPGDPGRSALLGKAFA